MPVRLRPHLHFGQETGDLGQGNWVPRWLRQGRAHSCDTKIVSTAIHQRYGAIFPSGNTQSLRHTRLDFDRSLRFPIDG
jgi:hypothetical protein